MIMRAVFWIAVVAVFMPHGPDLGLGQAGGAASVLPSSITRLAGQAVTAPQQTCLQHADSCAEALGFVDRFQALAVQSLDQVKDEIESAQADHRRQRLAYND